MVIAICLSPCVFVCQPRCSSMNVITAHLCVHYVHVFISVFSLCVLNPQIIPSFILSSSSLTSLILSSLALFFTQPFIHLSLYPVISRSHPLPLCLSSFYPFFTTTSDHWSCPSSIPLDPVLARLSRCLKAWHQVFFFRRVQSLPYEMQCKELHSHLCKLVGSDGTEPEPEEKGAMQRGTDACSGWGLDTGNGLVHPQFCAVSCSR